MTSPPLLSARKDFDGPQGDVPTGAGSEIQPAGEPSRPDNHLERTAALRKALADGSQSPDSIIRAAAETARTLTGADGIALALRARGVVVCRARSGELAPELGSQLNAHSGISGECLRSASIQRCDDAENDSRVDPEVCRAMGIRSIAAVPLRGPVGVAGILEAFSARPGAFADEQINCLRALGLVAEAAYETERLAHEEETLARLRTPRLPPIHSSSADAKGKEADQSSANVENDEPANNALGSLLPRQYRVIGVAALALLLVLGVWLSWRDPAPETVSAQPASASHTLAESPTPTSNAATTPGLSANDAKSRLKPAPTKQKNDATLLKNAAQIESAESRPDELAPKIPELAPKPSPHTVAGGTAKSDAQAAPETTLVEPPPLTMPAQDQNQLAGLISHSESLPAADVRVSQGVTPAQLIRKVDPAYPAQARMQRISGSVELEITIGQDGSVGNVKQISGEPLLATAAISAVRRWRYVPVRLDGKAVQSEKRVTIVFRLPEN